MEELRRQNQSGNVIAVTLTVKFVEGLLLHLLHQRTPIEHLIETNGMFVLER